MKIQIDFPDEWDNALRIYAINCKFKTKAEAVVDLVKKQLESEQDMFTMTKSSKKSDYIKNI
jgi:hypothetical protein